MFRPTEMETQKKINDIRELISKNEIGDALTKMRQPFSDNSDLNDALLLSSQLNDIKRRILLNLIDYKEYAQFESRITSAILELLHQNPLLKEALPNLKRLEKHLII